MERMERDFMNGFEAAAYLVQNAPSACRRGAIQRITWLAMHRTPVVDATDAGTFSGLLAAYGIEPSDDLGYVQ